MSDPDAWLDDLVEGVVRIEGGRVVRLNRAAAAILGADAERARGLPAIAVLRDHRLERVWLEGDSCELTLRGRRVEVQRIDGGLALRDVTEARTAQENARELLAVLSHELRTPVTTIRSTLEALGYDDLPDETRSRLLARAAEEVDRLTRLLSDLTVDVAPPRERSVLLAPLAERACAVLAPVLTARRVEVRRDLPRLTVWADPDKVLQVLLNLIENAAIHGPSDATVDVVAEVAPPAPDGTSDGTRDGAPPRAEDAWVAIRVRDRGEPLPPARLEALFALRARGPSPKARGTGLGLYVVRSIAERWGGEAWGRPWRGAGPDAGEAGNEFGVRVPARREDGAGPLAV
jgi:signal transduction histidine kinase